MQTHPEFLLPLCSTKIGSLESSMYGTDRMVWYFVWYFERLTYKFFYRQGHNVVWSTLWWISSAAPQMPHLTSLIPPRLGGPLTISCMVLGSSYTIGASLWEGAWAAITCLLRWSVNPKRRQDKGRLLTANNWLPAWTSGIGQPEHLPRLVCRWHRRTLLPQWSQLWGE